MKDHKQIGLILFVFFYKMKYDAQKNKSVDLLLSSLSFIC